MIYRLFNINKPIVLSILPLICIIFWIPSLYNENKVGLLDSYSLFEFLDQMPEIMVPVLSIFIILSTAIVLSYTINKSELFSKNQYLPALIYTIIMCAANNFHALNSIILGNFLISLAISILFRIYRQVPCKNLMFKSTSLILLASIFYYPFLIFFPLPWIVLSIIRPFNTKEWLMPIVSLALIIFYLILINTINPTFLDINIKLNTNSKLTPFDYTLTLKIVYGLLMAGCFFSLLMLLKLNAKSTNRFRKLSLLLFSVFFIFIVLSVLSFYYINLSTLLILAAIPVSLLLPFLLIHLRKKWLSEIYLSTLFLLVLFDLYFN